MTIDELYKKLITPGSSLCYPFCYDNKEEDFLDYVMGLIQEYLAEVKKLDAESIEILNHVFDALPVDVKPLKAFDFERDVKAVAKLVEDALSASLKSYHEDAYSKFRSFFVADDYFYLGMLPQLEVDENSPCFYRIRQDKIDVSKGDGELFHIPFEKRYLVSTQRYSIPGYPAFYLAGDFFTSWCEMDCPKFEGLSYAKFMLKEKFRLLDIGLPYRQDSSLWEKYSLCAMYPILIACMVRVKHPNTAFKPEYLMPQLMMKLVRDHGAYLQGIVYMSNKIPATCNLFSLASRNLVFCVNNTLSKSGYDKDLANKMQMTNIQTITKEQADAAIMYCGKNFTIDFRKLIPEDENYHDINITME